jgi:hypothetical protein
MGRVTLGGCLLAALATVGCSGSEDSPAGSLPPGTDLSGAWYVEEVVSGNCPGSNYPEEDAYWMDVQQTSDGLVLTVDGQEPVAGTLEGNTLTWEGTRQSSSGVVSISFSGSIASDAQSGSGAATWTWTDGSLECSGTTQVTMSKPEASGQALQGTLFGLASDSAGAPMGWFILPLHQRGADLGGSFRGLLDSVSLGCTAVAGQSTSDGFSLADEFGQLALSGTLEATSHAFVGTLTYSGAQGSFVARLVNPVTLTANATATVEGVDTGLAYDGSKLWSATTMSPTVSELQLTPFDASGTSAGAVESLPYRSVSGLGASDGGFWLLSTGSGSVLARYEGQPLALARELTIDDSFPRGLASSLEWVWWLGGDYGQVLKRRPTTDGPEESLALLGTGNDHLTYFDHSVWLLPDSSAFDCSNMSVISASYDLFVVDEDGTPKALYSLDRSGAIATDGQALWLLQPSFDSPATLLTYPIP